MGAAFVPLEIDCGEDWTTSIVYTDDYDQPYNVIHPCRLDILDKQGQSILSLTSPDTEVPEGTIPEIGISSEIGLLQLHIEDAVTATINPGEYMYDLFITVDDGNEYAGSQVQRLLKGTATFDRRYTKL